MTRQPTSTIAKTSVEETRKKHVVPLELGLSIFVVDFD